MMKNVPRGVWMLGLVSLFMDLSSEMIHAVLPLFVVGTLGASAALLGLIEGIAEATAQFAKLFSGILSDRWRSRKGLTLAGYGLAAVVKPLFPMATTAYSVFVARFADRIGKGIRGAPRDAMVADMTPEDLRGAAFGLRQSLDTVGAFAGPLIAVVILAAVTEDLRTVLWIACVPALVSVAILALLVREPDVQPKTLDRPSFNMVTARSLGREVWMVTGLAALVMLARFSEAFLVLKAATLGLSLAYVPLVMVAMSLFYSLSSYPAGAVSDRLGRKGLLVVGLATLVIADVVLASTKSTAEMFAGVALWGLHMGLTQGILTTMVADAAPKDLRGTAFGMFNMVSGVAALAASLGAGLLWDSGGARLTFLAGALVAAGAALASMLLVTPSKNHHGRR